MSDPDSISGPATGRRRPRRRRILKWVAIVGMPLLAILGGIAYWALDRYVIDHVVISDARAYESEVLGTTTTLPSETVTVTDDGYSDGHTTISIEKVVTGSGEETLTYFVADVRLSDATYFKSAFARNKFGSNIVEDTSAIALRNNAIFAVNGDYYGFRRTGIMIRNGVSYMNQPRRPGLALYRDGTMRIYEEDTTSAKRLLADGVWNTASFGPPLVDDGRVVRGIDKVEIDTNWGNHSIQGRQPRAGFGMIAPNHFLFIVADGRAKGYSRGVGMIEFAELFVARGARVAYNLDGGGSATMYFNGRVVNRPGGKNDERPTSDIYYIPSALPPTGTSGGPASTTIPATGGSTP